ncbi:hypothetical protein B1J94_18730 [Leptospira kirschneri serovar Grippotyphosa]|nr:hypothetical protein B1J94_18730 [Leptospira kirschneri serovar Grippotyphosa]
MNSPSVSISWKRAIEIVLLNATMEFCNNSTTENTLEISNKLRKQSYTKLQNFTAQTSLN